MTYINIGSNGFLRTLMPRSDIPDIRGIGRREALEGLLQYTGFLQFQKLFEYGLPRSFVYAFFVFEPNYMIDRL